MPKSRPTHSLREIPERLGNLAVSAQKRYPMRFVSETSSSVRDDIHADASKYIHPRAYRLILASAVRDGLLTKKDADITHRFLRHIDKDFVYHGQRIGELVTYDWYEKDHDFLSRIKIEDPKNMSKKISELATSLYEQMRVYPHPLVEEGEFNNGVRHYTEKICTGQLPNSLSAVSRGIDYYANVFRKAGTGDKEMNQKTAASILYKNELHNLRNSQLPPFIPLSGHEKYASRYGPDYLEKARKLIDPDQKMQKIKTPGRYYSIIDYLNDNGLLTKTQKGRWGGHYKPLTERIQWLVANQHILPPTVKPLFTEFQRSMFRNGPLDEKTIGIAERIDQKLKEKDTGAVDVGQIEYLDWLRNKSKWSTSAFDKWDYWDEAARNPKVLAELMRRKKKA